MRRNRSPFRRFVSSPFTLIVSLIILLALGRATSRIHDKVTLSATRVDEAQARLDRLSTRETAMKDQIDRLSTNEGIVRLIREKYHAVEPGESVAVVIDKDASTTRSTTAPAVAEKTFWDRLLRFIGF